LWLSTLDLPVDYCTSFTKYDHTNRARNRKKKPGRPKGIKRGKKEGDMPPKKVFELAMARRA
jgi:hypothetical protein